MANEHRPQNDPGMNPNSPSKEGGQGNTGRQGGGGGQPGKDQLRNPSKNEPKSPTKGGQGSSGRQGGMGGQPGRPDQTRSGNRPRDWDDPMQDKETSGKSDDMKR